MLQLIRYSYFILGLLCLPISSFAQENLIKFDRIGAEQGLPQSTVNAIVQDSVGFLWIGTPDGLYKYDGYSFAPIRHNPADTTTLSDNNILALYMGSHNKLWIGTAGAGLNCFDLDRNQIIRYPVNINDPKGLSDITIRGMAEDRYGNLWMSSNKGINVLNISSGIITKYRHIPNNEKSIIGDDLRAIYYDKNDNIWFGTEDGIGVIRVVAKTHEIFNYTAKKNDRYAIKSNIIRAFTEDLNGTLYLGSDGNFLIKYDAILDRFSSISLKITPKFKNSISRISSLLTDSKGQIWIGTIRNGIGVFNPQNNKVDVFQSSPNLLSSLSSNKISYIFEGRSKIIWIGTLGGGINKYSSQQSRFTTLRNDPQNPNSLTENTIRSLMETKDGKLWIGTINGGLNIYDRKKNKFTSLTHEENKPNTLPINDVSALYELNKETILIGTWRGGLSLYNPNTKKIKTYVNEPNNNQSISDGRIQKIIRIPNGQIWIGTEYGLNLFDLKKQTFKHYFENQKSETGLTDNRIQSLYADNKNNLWIGTWYGLNYLNTKTNKVTKFYADLSDKNKLSNNSIISICAEGDSVLWLGTYGGGLQQLKINNQDVSKSYVSDRFTTETGLPSNSIFGVLDDNHGNLWLSTTKGLSRFTKKSKIFRNYDVLDGLQSEEFYWGAYTKLQNGEMAFGGLNGLNIFSPISIVDNPYSPNVVITSITYFDKQIDMPTALYNLKKLDLRYDQNHIFISFSALDFVNPLKNKYQYKLEGFNSDWINVGNNHSVTYTNLTGGTYYFKVKGTNSDGVWNHNDLTLEIIIKPPFWETLWFRLLASILVFGLITLFYYRRIRYIERQKTILENQIAERTLELSIRKNEVEKINEIVKTINKETDFKKVIVVILEEISKLNSVDLAAAFILDKESKSYRLEAGIGFDTNEFKNISLHNNTIEEYCLTGADQVQPDLWIHSKPNNRLLPVSFFSKITSIITILIRVDSEIQGCFVFALVHSDQEFSPTDIQLLGHLREHLTTAFIKAKILEELSFLNEKKNEFLGIAAHDLRSPLTAMLNYLALIAEQIKTDNFSKEKVMKYLDKVLSTTTNMSEMVSTLLDISAIESGRVMLNIKRERLTDILRENEMVYKRLAEKKNISLNYQINSKIPEVIIDRDRIVEVIDNLVSNAIKYTYPGGSVVIYSEDHGSEIVTHVQDNGQGLTKEDLTRVFNTYTKLSSKPTAGESSTGLGLAIVQKIIHLHGGRVWVVSEKDKGSKFSFSLPVSRHN